MALCIFTRAGDDHDNDDVDADDDDDDDDDDDVWHDDSVAVVGVVDDAFDLTMNPSAI